MFHGRLDGQKVKQMARKQLSPGKWEDKYEKG